MIYFDNAATTRPSKKALKKAEIYNSDGFFNPSALYNGGVENKKAVKSAKTALLSHISAGNHDLIFTSCGSESDNQAIFKNHSRGAVLTTEGEHAAVYNSVKELIKRGRKVFFAPVNADGSVKVSDLYETVKNNTEIDFVSIVHVCNETGAINDINAISENLKKINKKIIFHSDGVQAYGKIPYKIGDGVDFYSVSAHKINGLKGVGALIKKKSVSLDPLIIGGGQEEGFRSGTENIFGIKTFEFAASERYENLSDNFARASEIRKI
ncbi:MAG: aminotransferase class V-fold PLP-dependent enzyme, partial [Clostridia bacterium]|nr:aminotransferase class V-fold PLP-dependent enzyme [Clostridia bacterium]